MCFHCLAQGQLVSEQSSIEPGRLDSFKRVLSKTFSRRRSSKAGSDVESGTHEEHWGAYMGRCEADDW